MPHGRTLTSDLVVAGLLAFIAAFPTLAQASVSPRSLWGASALDSRAKIEQLRRCQQRITQERISGNEASYDARTYALDLTLDPEQERLDGIVRMRAEVIAGPLLQIDVDLASTLAVGAVTSDGISTTYSHQNDLLSISLDRPYFNGEIVDLVITYGGDPSPGGAWHWDVKDDLPMVWTVSEPYGAHTWWPCKDLAADKADTVEVRVTAPSGMVTASNGVLVSFSDDGVHSIYNWREKYPIASYLVFVASYPYITETDWYHPAFGDSMAIRFYIFPSDLDLAHVENPKVKTMVSIFSGLFGEYPFLDEKYGEAECMFPGGMEHQTCTSLGSFDEGLSAHELAHQWWGDAVTCRDFHHIWLNEGFASYCGGLYIEATEGTEAYFSFWEGRGYYGPGTVYVPDDTDIGRIFDHNLSYRKASWVLHMLRFVLGDDDFFASLRTYFESFKYSVATTEDFHDVCESVSGRDLDWYFQEWIYGEYYPAYSYEWSAAPAGRGYDVLLNVRQKQDWQIFKMPLEVTIHSGAQVHTFVVTDSLETQDFILHVPEQPERIALDERGWLLKTVDEPVMNPPFDRGVLLVNGLVWTLGEEVWSAYEDRAFWGDYDIDFWDVFAEPEGGYPSTLPVPIGRGAVPSDNLGHYREVIWVGNNVNGDLDAWRATSIESYLRAGGNLLLMTKQGDQFFDEALRAYIGVQWATGATLYDCIATHPDLTDIERIGNQTLCKVFGLTLTQPDSRVIYKVRQNFDPERGIGAWRQPIGGGTWRPNGGQFVFLSGRPYRWNHLDLRTNVMTILRDFFGEPILPADLPHDPTGTPTLSLETPWPNPTRPGQSRIAFNLPRAGRTRLAILDVAGRSIGVLLDDVLPAGLHTTSWGRGDFGGRSLPSGVYFVLLDAPGGRVSRKINVLD